MGKQEILMSSDKQVKRTVFAGFDTELSRWEVEHALERFAGVEQAERKEVPAGERGGVHLLDTLRKGEADLAVLDARLLPSLDLEEVSIPATLQRGVVNDALVCREHLGFSDLPPKATVGVTSSRQRAALYNLRNDLKTVALTDSLQERLVKIDSGKLDAALFSWVDLRRLGLAWRVDDVFGVTEMLPEPMAGISAILARADEKEVLELAGRAGHWTTLNRLRVELAFVRALQAAPGEAIACHSRDYGGEGMRLVARIYNVNGSEMLEAERSIHADEEPEVLGEKVAAELMERGAGKLLGR